MRPVHLELEGFFAYRDRTVLDLDGIEYFALEGPTGSGKSSLIDAMIFSLYGKVPRLGGATVAPAISAGAGRARVSFRFRVGEVDYTATRQIERTASGGARATEVRLETAEAVIASGGAEVSETVAGLLSLSYDDFIRTVVLPQGEFARFLTATPKDRQELLRGLLGLDVYRTMGTLARGREQAAAAEARSAAGRLDDLEVPDDEAMQTAVRRLESIEAFAAAAEEREAEIALIGEALKEAASRLERALDARKRLAKLAPPPRLEELSGLLDGIDEQLGALSEDLAHLLDRRASLDEEMAGMVPLDVLDRYEALYGRLANVDAELAGLDLSAAREGVDLAESGAAAARASHEGAMRELEAARTLHAAHAIARELAAGDICPVCRQRVGELATSQDPADLSGAEAAVGAASARLEEARRALAESSRELARVETAVARLADARSQLLEDLQSAPDRESMTGLRDRVVAAAKSRSTLDELIRSREKEISALEERKASLAEEQRSLGRLLMTEREMLADLKPPIAESEDVLIQWKELLVWRETALEDAIAAVGTVEAEVGEVREALAQAERSLTADLAGLGIEVKGSAAVSVARAEETARAAVRRNEAAMEQAGKLRVELERAEETAAIADALARHLRADGFERWMMVGAIADLVAGANTILGQLSESAYSLHSDDEGSFDIIDHRNADEIRPISTLSGGETFLVSLALALSLAETLSAGGGSRLDAIILDEGFGTLDEESLDVVATVLESLTLSGLMVGIITHVRALATRAPVRFVVRKGPGGSHVEPRE